MKKVKKSNLEKLREIVREHQYQKIQGVIVDATSANAILSVYDAINEANKEKYRGLIEKNIVKANSVAWTLLSK